MDKENTKKYRLALGGYNDTFAYAQNYSDAKFWAETAARDFPGQVVQVVHLESGEVKDYYRVPIAA